MLLSKLAAMTADERGDALDRLLASADGVPAHVQEEIRTLESRYEMRSSAMVEKMRRGEIPDIADTARWVVLLRARGDVR